MEGEKKKYVVYGMRAKCSQGTMENYISTDVGHGVVYQGQPLLNANDHVKGVNLTHFGDCNSKKVYEEAKKEIDEKLKAKEGDGFLAKAGKWIAKEAMKASITMEEYLTFNKCELNTPTPWIFINEEHMIDGAPALTIESRCACMLGGIITIAVEENEEENVELEQVDDKVAEYEEMLMEKYSEHIAAFMKQQSGEELNEDEKKLIKEMMEVDITKTLQEMGNEINGMAAVQNNKNQFINFINLVNTGQPLDLKNRQQVNPKTGQEIKIWQLPWGDGKGGNVAQDYAGNWIFGYMGAEYFTTPIDDKILKYGAGAAQFVSDINNETIEMTLTEKINKYITSLGEGNYGDNPGDSDKIQEGIDAYNRAQEE